MTHRCLVAGTGFSFTLAFALGGQERPPPRWGVGLVGAAALSNNVQPTGGGADVFLRLTGATRWSMRAEALATWLPPEPAIVCVLADPCDTRRVRFVRSAGLALTAGGRPTVDDRRIYAVAGLAGFVTRWRGERSDASGRLVAVPPAGPAGIAASIGAGTSGSAAWLRLRAELRLHVFHNVGGRPARLVTLAIGPIF